MQNAQPRIEPFVKGERLSAARLNELADMVSRLIWQKQHAYGAAFGTQQPRNIQVILDADLYAAVDTKDDPSTAQASVLVRRNDRLVNSGRKITITNRFENISVDAGTYGKAEWIDGEWQLYAADCPGGSISESGSVASQ